MDEVNNDLNFFVILFSCLNFVDLVIIRMNDVDELLVIFQLLVYIFGCHYFWYQDVDDPESWNKLINCI